MKKSYQQLVAEEARLVVLRVLAEAPAYEANSSTLQMILPEYALNLSRDQLHTELAWLAEQGLVSTRAIATVVIATITARGLDVAHARAQVPGVKRPGPPA